MKNAALFAAKSIVFTAIFWSLWTFVFRPITASVSNSQSTSQSQSTDSQDELMAKYWEQALLADKIQAKYVEQAKLADEQQRRYAALFDRQDEILTRLDRVVRKWEAQATPRK